MRRPGPAFTLEAMSRSIAVAGLLVGQAPAHVVDEDGFESRLHFPQMEDRALEALEPAEHLPDHVVYRDHYLELHRSGSGMRGMGDRANPDDPPKPVQIPP